jgi:hypothetical protein
VTAASKNWWPSVRLYETLVDAKATTIVRNASRGAAARGVNDDDLRGYPLDRRPTPALAKAGPSLRLNKHIEDDGPHRVRSHLQNGLGGHRVEAEGFDLSLRPIAGSAKGEAEENWGPLCGAISPSVALMARWTSSSR